MSLDFFVTHFYRLVVHDVVLMSDVYWFYTAGRREGQSLKEFAEILSNLLEVESQNFEEINTAKLSIGEGESVLLIIWDYFHDVIIKHLLDDASQFPFWASKVIVTSQPHKFGMPIIRAYFDCMNRIYAERGIRGLFEGSAPYMLASCYHNYKFLVKVTHSFIHNVFSKIPHPGTAPVDDELTSPMGSPVPRAKKQLTSGDTTFTFPSAEGGSGKLNSALSGGSGKGLGMGKKTSLTDLSILAGGNNVSLSSARESVKEAMNGAVTNAVQMVHNLAPEFTPRIGGFNSTGVNSSSSSSATSSSSVGSTGGVAAGGPFALSHGPPGASTAHLMGAPGGGSGHFSSVSALRAKKQPSAQPQGGSAIVKIVEKGMVAFMTHPLMVLAVTMVTDPLYYGQNCLVSFFKMSANRGIVGQYCGLRSRIVLSLIPLSPLMMLGVADAVIYRRMEGQGAMDNTGGVVSVIKQITAEGSVLNLFNYGLLTAVHVVPGFISFVAMRSLSWLLMGSSLQRKHQISRRRDIVNAHISLINKKAPYE